MKGINLQNLCRANKWPEVRKYLSSDAAEDEKKYNIMYRDDDWGRTCLYTVCYSDAPDDIVEAMINSGGKELVMKADDNNNDTVLHTACDYGASYDIIKMLIEVGGKDLVMAKNNDGNTALYFLCQSIEEDTKVAEKVKLIFQVGDANLLLSICSDDYWSEVRKYLSSDAAEEEKRSNIMYRNHDGTCVHAACYYGAPDDIIKTLLDIGGKELVMEIDNNDDTALHSAFMNDASCNIIKMLIEVGGKDLIMAMGERDKTALHFLCSNNHNYADDIIKTLLDIGGKELVMQLDDDNCTVLHLAFCRESCINKMHNIIKMIIEVGGKYLVMAKDWNGDTALHNLCWFIKRHTKAAEIINIILQVGDTNLLLSTKNHDGNTPLEIATDRGASKEIQKLLTVQSNSKRKPCVAEHQEEGEEVGSGAQSQSSKRSRIGNAADTGSKVKLEVGLKGKLEVGSKIKLEAESKENYSERVNATSSSSGNLILDKVPSPSSTSDGIQPTRWSNRARKPSARSHEDLMSITSIFDIPIPPMEPTMGESFNIVGKRTLPSSNENKLTVRKSSPVSKPPVVGNFKVFCKISRNDSVLESTYSDASAFTSSFNIGFMTLPCSSTSTFADARSTMLSDLDEDCLPHKWKFFVPYLGPMSIKQEARSGSILQFLKNAMHGDQFGDGTAKSPLRVFIYEYK
jgi:ankyrin repeat protein